MGSRCTLLIYISSSVVRESPQQICIEKTLSSRATLLRLYSFYNFSASFILHYPAQSSRKGEVMRRWFILEGKYHYQSQGAVPGIADLCRGWMHTAQVYHEPVLSPALSNPVMIIPSVL